MPNKEPLLAPPAGVSNRIPADRESSQNVNRRARPPIVSRGLDNEGMSTIGGVPPRRRKPAEETIK